ncbi:hypothetical protein HaLaN_28046, partial [Haematococcus lacustris]
MDKRRRLLTLNNLFQGLRLKQLRLDIREESPLPNLQPLAQHLTQLHISTSLWAQQELDALLAATQLTSIQLHSINGLTSSRADAPCSWQRLELTASSWFIRATTAAYLPLHSLTYPLLLSTLGFISQESTALVTAAVHNLTQTCKVPVKGCTHLQFFNGSLTPTLKFWRQLVQLLPTVRDVAFRNVKGASSAAMCKSLRSMAQQPWVRWLDIVVMPEEQSLSE